MDLIKPFEPKEVQSSVELADRLNEMARVINLILANPTGALQLLVDAEKKHKEKMLLQKASIEANQTKPFSGLYNLGRRQLEQVATSYDVAKPEALGTSRLIAQISLKVEENRKKKKELDDIDAALPESQKNDSDKRERTLTSFQNLTRLQIEDAAKKYDIEYEGRESTEVVADLRRKIEDQDVGEKIVDVVEEITDEEIGLTPPKGGTKSAKKK